MKNTMRLGTSGILRTTTLSAALAFAKCGGDTPTQDMMKPPVVDMGSNPDMTSLPSVCNSGTMVLNNTKYQFKLSDGSTGNRDYALLTVRQPESAIFQQIGSPSTNPLTVGKSLGVSMPGGSTCDLTLCAVSGSMNCTTSGGVFMGSCTATIVAAPPCTLK